MKSIAESREYDLDDDGRSAQYYGSFIVIPISVTVIIVVIVCAVAYIFVYLEERKTSLVRASYMSPSRSQNFQFFGPNTSSSPIHAGPTLATDENNTLSLRYDGSDRGVRPLLPRPSIGSSPSGHAFHQHHQQQGPPIPEENEGYTAPYESLRDRSLSLPPVPPRNLSIAVTNSARLLQASQAAYVNSSESSSLSASNVYCKAEVHVQDEPSSQIYDYFTFRNV